MQRFAFGNLRANEGGGTDGATWEQPFVFEVPSFPLRKRARRHYGKDAETEDSTDGGGLAVLVPPHLPAFPPARTWVPRDGDSRGGPSKGDTRAVMAERRRRNRLVRRSLVRIVQVTWSTPVPVPSRNNPPLTTITRTLTRTQGGRHRGQRQRRLECSRCGGREREEAQARRAPAPAAGRQAARAQAARDGGREGPGERAGARTL
mmetsp:Transcript_38560/g.120725  ORF Transcript_38560/g.120725 Transcript_38560/m.120725 type:complete len:205 (-) Transcript_38560:383-997(-)